MTKNTLIEKSYVYALLSSRSTGHALGFDGRRPSRCLPVPVLRLDVVDEGLGFLVAVVVIYERNYC